MPHKGDKKRQGPPPAAEAPSYPSHGIGRVNYDPVRSYHSPYPPPPLHYHANAPMAPPPPSSNQPYGYQPNFGPPSGDPSRYGGNHRPPGPPYPAPTARSQAYGYNLPMYTPYAGPPPSTIPPGSSIPTTNTPLTAMGSRTNPPPPSSTLTGARPSFSSNLPSAGLSTSSIQGVQTKAASALPKTKRGTSSPPASGGYSTGGKGVASGNKSRAGKGIPANADHPHHHQDKNPAKKKRGRPALAGRRGSSSKKSAGAGGGTSRASNRPSGRSSTGGGGGGGGGGRSPAAVSPSKQKQQKQQQVNRGPMIQIVSDEDPARIVNPLLEIPSESSQNEPIHGSEMLTMMDLVFYKPDTYPLSYLGRLLGFDIPVPSLFDNDDNYEGNTEDGDEKTQEDSVATMFTKQPTYPTPLPDVNTLPFLKKTPEHDVFFQVPPAGKRALIKQAPVSQLGDDDDRFTLDYTDPVYAYFLQHGFNKSKCKSGTAHTVAKVAAPLQTTRSSVQQSVLDLAESLDLLESTQGWSFADWTSWKPDAQETVQPLWTLDDDKVYTKPPTQSFGVMASFHGHPMILLHYKFQWYQMWERKESELIMVMEGLVERSGSRWVERRQEEPSLSEFRTAKDVAKEVGLYEGIVTEDVSVPSAGSVEEETTKPAAQPNVDLPKVTVTENIRLILMALALDHARAADVWYCLWNSPKELVESNRNMFRMVHLPKYQPEGDGATASSAQPPTGTSSTVPMICDLKKCSSRYALLKCKEIMQQRASATKASAAAPAMAVTTSTSTTFHQRALVKMPLLEEAKACFDSNFAEMQRSKRSSTTNADSNVFAGASGKARDVFVGVRATLLPRTNDGNSSSCVKLQVLEESGAVSDDISLLETTNEKGLPQLDLMRRFPLPMEEESTQGKDGMDEVLKELEAKQALLMKTETAMEPHLRFLMKQVVAERLEWEQPDARERRAEEKRIIKRMEDYVARRKEEDLARQEQREQDMNAVCSICNDGEVTPENQILFCEACDVPVHQMCYGIEEIPEGDYYCIACRHFEREKLVQERDNNPEAVTNSSGGRVALPPLPIRCELCPIKHGAYTKTATSQSDPKATEPKWIHMACAKWQGLDFVVPTKPDLIEDVGLLKSHFRQLDIRCAVCQAQRGAYHQCREEGCAKWLHVTCARALAVCEVVHGEDVEGNPTTNGWTLKCPEHSEIDPEEIERDPVPVEKIIELAKELPDDPMPEPPPEPHKPFNKLTGKERRRALSDPAYETEFLDEILTKRLAGVRCEVCYTLEDDGKTLARCKTCQCVICCFCRLSDGEVTPEQKNFKCSSCRFVSEKERAQEEYTTPQCQFCNQTFGLLLESFAQPVNRKGYWKNNENEYSKTLFARKLWSHYTCAFWLKKLEIDSVKVTVDCSAVVMTHGKGYILSKSQCALCGLNTGMKEKCADQNCRARGEKRIPYSFHITCARQAGYEVQQDDNRDPQFYVHCYFHGALEYNLRARLEDLIEIEKRRSGKKLSRSEAPMTFSDGARILNSAMLVVRMLGWAWRWAEHWVEYGSNWEPLVEPGQKESNMTKKQLKIVESTPESRAKDARRCRLAAFGAAIRNRSYDTEVGFDEESFCRALNAILRTPSLVGPLKDFEIEFFIDWLFRAYRSKSKFLALGDNKVPVAEGGVCVHQADKSPKFELGNRPLPGKAKLQPGEIFEPKVEEPDDFLLPELLPDGSPCPYPPNSITLVPRKELQYRKAKPGEDDFSEDDDEEESKQSSKKSIGKKSADPEKVRKQSKAKETVTIEKQKKKPGRPSQDESLKVPSQYDSVAAMVPSAVKKRGQVRTDRSSIEWSPALESPRIRKSTPSPASKDLISTRLTQGLLVLHTQIEYHELLARNNDDSVLRKMGRRGRPPRFLEFYTHVTVDGEEYNPDEDGSDDDLESDVVEANSDEANGTESEKMDIDAPTADDDSKAVAMSTSVDKTTISPVEKEGHVASSNHKDGSVDDKEDTIEENPDPETEGVVEKDANLANASSEMLAEEAPQQEIIELVEQSAKEAAAKRKEASEADIIDGGEEADPGHSLAREEEATVYDTMNIKRKRMLNGLEMPIFEATRKRRPTKPLDPSSSIMNSYDESTSDNGPPPSRRRGKRKRDEKPSKNEDPDSNASGMRRSSRQSSARDMSYKEPDDTFSDLDDADEEEVVMVAASKKKPGKRASRASAAASKSTESNSPRRKRRRANTEAKQSDRDEATSESEDDESFVPNKDGEVDIEDDNDSLPSKDDEKDSRDGDMQRKPLRGRTSRTSAKVGHQDDQSSFGPKAKNENDGNGAGSTNSDIKESDSENAEVGPAARTRRTTGTSTKNKQDVTPRRKNVRRNRKSSDANLEMSGSGSEEDGPVLPPSQRASKRRRKFKVEDEEEEAGIDEPTKKALNDANCDTKEAEAQQTEAAETADEKAAVKSQDSKPSSAGVPEQEEPVTQVSPKRMGRRQAAHRKQEGTPGSSDQDMSSEQISSKEVRTPRRSSRRSMG